MSKLGISTGSSPNDRTGDTLLQGAVKVNSNFDEVYTFLGDGSTLTTIENNKLANSSVSFGGISLSLGSSDDTPAFDLTDATNYPFTSLTGITTEILGDTTPQLGGDLDVNGNDIIGTGNVNLTGIITATSFTKSGGTSSQFLKADGSVDSSTYLTSYTETDPVVAAINGIVKSNGTSISAAVADTDYLTPTGDGSSLTGLTGASADTYGDASNVTQIVVDANGRITSISEVSISGGGGISDVVQDTTPQLGGDLDVNGNDIIGTGNVNLTGIITASSFYGNGSNLSGVVTSLVGYATEGYVDNSIVGFITSGDLDGYATESYVSSASVSFASTAGISSAVIETIDINTTGIITASSFSGSGTNLTNLSAGQLTGNLPALDGSALLNLPAQPGDGIIVEDDGVNIGSARTVNFGTGIDVQYNASTGIATVNASGDSLQSRTTISGSTASISNNGIGNTDITGFKSYALMKVGLSTTGWLRIYTDSTSRSNDISRSVGEDPLPGSGVIAEVVTTGISTTQIISPFVTGGNLDEPASETIYVSIKNLSGSTQSITANLTILQLEA